MRLQRSRRTNPPRRCAGGRQRRGQRTTTNTLPPARARHLPAAAPYQAVDVGRWCALGARRTPKAKAAAETHQRATSSKVRGAMWKPFSRPTCPNWTRHRTVHGQCTRPRQNAKPHNSWAFFARAQLMPHYVLAFGSPPGVLGGAPPAGANNVRTTTRSSFSPSAPVIACAGLP